MSLDPRDIVQSPLKLMRFNLRDDQSVPRKWRDVRTYCWDGFWFVDIVLLRPLPPEVQCRLPDGISYLLRLLPQLVCMAEETSDRRRGPSSGRVLGCTVHRLSGAGRSTARFRSTGSFGGSRDTVRLQRSVQPGQSNVDLRSKHSQHTDDMGSGTDAPHVPPQWTACKCPYWENHADSGLINLRLLDVGTSR